MKVMVVSAISRETSTCYVLAQKLCELAAAHGVQVDFTHPANAAPRPHGPVPGVNDVRAGKLIELDLADGTSDADIEDMCRKLLANTVIENFRIERLEHA